MYRRVGMPSRNYWMPFSGTDHDTEGLPCLVLALQPTWKPDTSPTHCCMRREWQWVEVFGLWIYLLSDHKKPQVVQPGEGYILLCLPPSLMLRSCPISESGGWLVLGDTTFFILMPILISSMLVLGNTNTTIKIWNFILKIFVQKQQHIYILRF